MKSTKKLILVMVATLLIIGGVFPAHASNNVSITDIREEAADGWHQTYEAHGRTIIVDTEIVIPEVEKVPVLQVEHLVLQPVGDYEESEMVPNNFAYGFFRESREGVFSGASGSDSYEIVGDDARAENNPLSRQEAELVAMELFKQFESQIGPLDLRLSGYYATSREYERVGRDGVISDFNLDKPTSEMGTYFLQYKLYFHGIPLAGINPAMPQINPDYKTPKAQGMNHATIATREDYSFVITPYIEKEIIYDDVPLAAFSTVQSTLEDLIHAGLLREIRRIGLSYYSYFDKANPGETFILQPVWLIWGDYVESASAPDNPPLEFHEEYDRKFGGMPIMVDAFTGELLGTNANWDYADLSRY